MIGIQIDSPFRESVDTDWIEQAARAALQHEGASDGTALTIAIVDDPQIQKLNQQFLNIDAPTDVLSFPAEEIDPDTGLQYLGDVVISYPRTLDQARVGGHSLSAEMQLLVVHGILHLLGHDHAEEVEKGNMWAIQTAILKQIGSSITGPF